MKILIIEADPAEISRVSEKLSEHELKVIKTNAEFLAHALDMTFISSFDAVLLSNMFLSKSGRFLAAIGLVIAHRAIKKSVPYVGMFTYTDHMVSSWARKNGAKTQKSGSLTVAKINKTIVGSMINGQKKNEKDWVGLLSGLIAANAN